NLGELVNAAESFVTQEGFGRDAVALPVDEQANTLTQSPASQGLDLDAPMLDAPLPSPQPYPAGGRGSEEPPLPVGKRAGVRGDGAWFAPDVETGETLSPLAAFLTHAALEAGDNQAQAGQDAVQLMTVHASKGLEFDAVFITGLEEGLFPHENALSDAGGLEEERRLMYVAITRARRRLYLSHAQTRLLHGQTRYNLRSRFLDELPADVLKWLTPQRGGFASIAPQSIAARADWTSAIGQLGSNLSAPKLGSTTSGPAIRTGQQVFHVKFGEGRVLAVEGSGDDARAQVNFPRHGVKWLALAIAKLTVVD
ncbi:MAG TPA: 3'-5' exonuclease, partial [Ottowia sp.]|nr:3'-5' exonuclease [Ottowia sp.]